MTRSIYSEIDKKLIENKTVLDLGTGFISADFLAKCAPKKIIAVSNSKEEIDAALEIRKESSVGLWLS